MTRKDYELIAKAVQAGHAVQHEADDCIRKIDAGLYVEEPEPEREFYCWAPDTEDGTERTEWYVRDSTDDAIVAGPFDWRTALRESARRNHGLEAGAK